MKNKHAVALAKRRARKLTPERRKEIARMGGIAKGRNARAKESAQDATS